MLRDEAAKDPRKISFFAKSGHSRMKNIDQPPYIYMYYYSNIYIYYIDVLCIQLTMRAESASKSSATYLLATTASYRLTVAVRAFILGLRPVII